MNVDNNIDETAYNERDVYTCPVLWKYLNSTTVLIALKVDFCLTYKHTFSSVPTSYKLLMKACPCGRYRQLYSII